MILRSRIKKVLTNALLLINRFQNYQAQIVELNKNIEEVEQQKASLDLDNNIPTQDE